MRPFSAAAMVADGGGLTFKDIIFVIQPGHPLFNRLRGYKLPNFDLGPGGNSITSTSTISGMTNIAPASDWTTSDNIHATSLASLGAAHANPWTGNAGANLCHRYVNRARTTTPLWPWPMNQRIKDATGTAGAYSGPCQGCVGTFPIRTAVDVMADIQTLLGPIPAACRR